MRKMADSINAANLPASSPLRALRRFGSLDPAVVVAKMVAALPDGWDLYAGYVDGAYQSYVPAVARFGLGRVVPIAVFSTTNAGLVGDVENGDMTPQTAVAWVVMRRAAGVDPTIYCSLALWPAVRAAFQAAGVAEPHYWIAAYPGNGEQLYPGSIAHQWADAGPYDESVVADFWPGFDAAPAPSPTPAPAPSPAGGTMAVSPIIQFKPGQLDAFQVSEGVLWHKYAQAGKWSNEAVTLPAGFGPVTGSPEVAIVGGACWVTVEDASGKACAFVQTQSGAGSASWANQPLP